MQTVLSKVAKADVVAEPYPYLVVRDALDADLVARLIAEYPGLDRFEESIGRPSRSNERISLSAHTVVDDERVSQTWRDFVRAHVSQEFLGQLVDLFGDHIRRVYPDFEERYGALATATAGMRGVDSFDDHPIILDAQPSVNTPVSGTPDSVRRGHLDQPDKLFAGLYYLRPDEDDSQGGDFEIYRYKRGRPRGLQGVMIDDTFIEPVARVPYSQNTLVLMLNTPHALHGVTVRQRTPHARLFLNLVAEVREPLFDLAPLQATTADKLALAPSRLVARARKLARA